MNTRIEELKKEIEKLEKEITMLEHKISKWTAIVNIGACGIFTMLIGLAIYTAI